MIRSLTRAVILGCLLTALAGCQSGKEEDAYRDLTGVWETPLESYAGSSWEIHPDELVIVDLEGGVAFHRIISIASEPQDDKMLYRIRYRSKEGLEYLLPFLYGVENGTPVLRHKNRPQVPWYRTSAASEP